MTVLTLPPVQRHRSSFTDAVKSFWLDALRVDGRASRSTYWWAQLHVVIISALLGAIGSFETSNAVAAFISELVQPVFAVILIVPQTTLIVRRLHDRNHRGWWALLQLVPFGSLVILIWTILPGTQGVNRFDRTAPVRRRRSTAHRVLDVVGSIIAGEVALLVAVGLAIWGALLVIAINASLVSLGETPEDTVMAAPGVFNVSAVNPVDVTAGVTLQIQPLGWHLTALIVALMLILWRAAIDRHERARALPDQPAPAEYQHQADRTSI